MTGANRLLIGVGWTMVIFIAYFRLKRDATDSRRRRTADGRACGSIASTRSRSGSWRSRPSTRSRLPLKHSITLIDSAILVAIFVAYTIRVSRAPAEEPHLVGPARYIGTFATAPRRITVVSIAVFAAAVILLFAEHFAEALVLIGREPRRQRVPARAVGGTARLGGARVADRRSVRLAAEHERRPRHARLVEGEPVDAAGRHAADRVRRSRPAGCTGCPSTRCSARSCSSRPRSRSSPSRSCSSLTMSLREAVFLFALFWGQFILGGDRAGTTTTASSGSASGIVYLVLGVWVLVSDRFILRQLAHDAFRAPYDELARGARGRRGRRRSPPARLSRRSASRPAPVALPPWTPRRSCAACRPTPPRRTRSCTRGPCRRAARRSEPFPDDLPELLVLAARAARACDGLYPHQADGLAALRSGRDVVDGDRHREREDARVQRGVRRGGDRARRRPRRCTCSRRRRSPATSCGRSGR